MRSVEKWVPVPGYEGLYLISDKGNLRSFYHGKYVKTYSRKAKTHDSPQGYALAILCKQGVVTRITMSRLVLLAFVGEPPADKPYACHNDGDPSNNTLPNLRWGSNADNQADRNVHGTSNKGSANGRAKLAESDVLLIKRRLASGERQSAIAVEYGVDPSAISGIAIGRNWAHL